MASMKTMMMMLLDVGPTMKDPVSSAISTTKLELGKAFMGHFILQRMMASKTAEFGVATYGDNFTNNYLNSSQGGYENVNEIVSMDRPSSDSLAAIHRIRPGLQQGDLIDGIIVAQDVLVRINAKKAFNRIMLIITDGETEVAGVDDLEAVVQQMKSINNYGLYIAILGKVTPDSSIVKKENAKLLHSLAKLTSGRCMEIENFTDSIRLLSGGLGLGTRPTLSKTTFEITPSLRLPCVYWGKVSKVSAPTLKKQGNAASTGWEDEDTLRRDISYRHPDDEEVEIPLDEKVKGYKYGPQYIPVTQAEEEMFKFASPATIQLIGFVAKSTIPREHCLDTPTYLHPQVNHAQGESILAALHHECSQGEGKVMLARWVKRENADPQLIALFPHFQPSPTGKPNNFLRMWVFYRIPFVEDIRDYQFPSLVSFASERKVQQTPALLAQRNAMSTFLQFHQVNHSTAEGNEPSAGAYVKAHASVHRVYQELHRRLLGCREDSMVDIGDPLVPPTITTTSEEVMLSSLSEEAIIKERSLRQLYDAFPLKAPEKTSKRKKRVFWSEIDVAPTAPSGNNTGVSGSESVMSSQFTTGFGGGFTGSSLPMSQFDAMLLQDASVNTTIEDIKSESVEVIPQPKRSKSDVSTTLSPTASLAGTGNVTGGASRYGIDLEAAAARRNATDSTASYVPMDDFLDDLPEFLVGSISPLEDFQAYLDHVRSLPLSPTDRDDLVSDAVKTMIKVIERTIHLGNSLVHYQRAVTFVAALQRVSYEEYDCQGYNQYLSRVVKVQYAVAGGKHHMFWELLQGEGLGLIGQEEIATSTVTTAEARRFFTE